MLKHLPGLEDRFISPPPPCLIEDEKANCAGCQNSRAHQDCSICKIVKIELDLLLPARNTNEQLI